MIAMEMARQLKQTVALGRQIVQSFISLNQNHTRVNPPLETAESGGHGQRPERAARLLLRRVDAGLKLRPGGTDRADIY